MIEGHARRLFLGSWLRKDVEGNAESENSEQECKSGKSEFE